jgi:tetratricopeptide (TPR) repeat protein
LFLAWLEVARGRWQSAKSAFDDAERMDGGGEARHQRWLAATLPFLEVPTADLEAVRRDVDRWDPRPTVGGTGALATALQPHLRLYLLSLASSRLGDDDRALRHARELEQLSALSGTRKVVAGLVATARADVAMRKGRAEEALSLLNDADGQVPLELVFVKPFATAREYTQEHARFLRAEALASLGRRDEALRWLETSFQGSAPELVYLAPVHLRRAAIYEQRGDTARALEHYERFVRLWEEGDPPTQRAVRQARDGIARLRRP